MTEDTNSSKVKLDRSTAYPAMSLKDAVDYSSKLISNYPKADFNRESAARAIWHSSLNGTAARKVAALWHFGLLEKNWKSYKNSDLAHKISTPIDDNEKKTAIIQALKEPKLYSDLIDEFTGMILPDTLSNVISRNHWISNKVSDFVTKLFKESLEYSWMLKDWVLQSPEMKENLELDTDSLPEDTLSTPDNEEKAVTPIQSAIKNNDYINVELPSWAIISYPSNIAFQVQINSEFPILIWKLEEIINSINEKI